MPTKLSKETVAKIEEMLRNKSESGMTNRDIAKVCGTSHTTIDNYAARIKKERESVVICPRCKRKVEKQFSFCPWCGEDIRTPLDHAEEKLRKLYILVSSYNSSARDEMRTLIDEAGEYIKEAQKSIR